MNEGVDTGELGNGVSSRSEKFVVEMTVAAEVAKIEKVAERRRDQGLGIRVDWEATLEPIHLSADGSCFVHDNDSVVGPNGTRVTMAKCFRGYILAQYINGDDEDPQRTVCVDEYMTNALERNALYEANCAVKQALKSQGPPASSATRRAVNIQKQ
jgi:hypothetical protein